jgi:hypothetical protein
VLSRIPPKMNTPSWRSLTFTQDRVGPWR